MSTPPDTAMARPSGACAICPPPSNSRGWRQADDGYKTCSSCLDKLRDSLADISVRYSKLDPTPSSTGDGERGAPGFGSRSPASVHVIAIRDHRSSTEAHVWVGGDGRVHRESERPPLSVYGTLETEATDVAERRGIEGRDWPTVGHLVRFLDLHLDWLTREDSVVEFAEQVRALLGQLKPLTGDPRQKPFARCPNTLDEGEHTRVCGGPLYPPPVTSGIIECRACERGWDREKDEWEKLGPLLRKTA